MSLLIGDLGGTNARFALAEPDGKGFHSELTMPCADFDTPEQAMQAYLDQTGSPEPDAICLAAAGAIVDGVVRFLNNHWTLDQRQVQQRFPNATVRLINDFEANAWCIPMLGEEDFEIIGTEAGLALSADHFSVGVLGPGTGLGIAGLLCREGKLIPVPGEGGHSGFAPESRLQLDVLNYLRQEFDRVSNERLLSGQGLQNIYSALMAVHGRQGRRPRAREIFAEALERKESVAVETVNLFFEVLGQVAGDLALSLVANQGVYIAGGICKRYPDLLKASSFRSGFENKGRYRSVMETIPTLLITHDEPGLLGAAFVARNIR